METQIRQECINKVELRGHVGVVRTQQVADRTHITFTVATNYAYYDKKGFACIDTHWANVRYIPQENEVELANKIHKGTKVHVIGRLKTERYTAANGDEFSHDVVIANKVEIAE